MPPVTTSGSRTALITWSVVFAILFVTAAIFSIYFYADASKAHDREDTLKKQYSELAPPGDLAGEAVAQLRDMRGSPPPGSAINPSMPLFDVALTQRDELTHLIGGPQVALPSAATERANSAMQQAIAAGKAVSVTISPTESLSDTITTLSTAVNTQKKQADSLASQLDQAKKDNQAQAAQFEQQRQEMAKNLEAVRAEQAKSAADAAAYQQSKDQSVGQIEAGIANERKQSADALNAANVQVAELTRQLTQAKQQISTLQDKLGQNRVNTEDPVTRHPDGHVIRIPSKDTVYIDIGSAQSVTPGLTFEVYDRIDGIPPAGDPSNDDNLPKGKASIEVVHVGPTSSECRVIHTELGQQIGEGDLIANLVYDPNIKYNFVVHGDFDLDRNGVATPQDAEIIKRLITQWGGKIMDTVNVDTDFVVLGKEPVVPTFTKEELQDPINLKKQQDAQAVADAYAKVRDTARELHIPILNQNRFLYLTGYYEQSRQ